MIVLVGFMGAGKTTVGRSLARRLGLSFVDTDDLIEARAGMSIPEIFAVKGERAFRELEGEVVSEILSGEDAVVALGGGALQDPALATAVGWTRVVYLEVGFSAAMRRIEGSGGRPMLEHHDPKALYAGRTGSYQRVADVTVATDDLDPEEVVDRILAKLGLAPPHEDVARIRVGLGDRSYDVVVGPGVSGQLGSIAAELVAPEQVMVVSHPELAEPASAIRRSLETAGHAVRVATIPEGENSKSLDVVAGLYKECADLSFHRGDLVVAVGGGVVCDVAGFVASTYNRGMPMIHVPTTLLAQVDAAIGGKTGVNLPSGKNLVGTIHQPRAVVCDVSLLRSLPAEEFASGMAEVIKHGLIADPGLLDEVRAGWRQLEARDEGALRAVVSRAVAVKAQIVSVDETERGARALLNYGHTFGHAIEQTRGFSGIRHGEAVALGMLAAAHAARLTDRIDDDVVALHRDLLDMVGLPTQADLDLGDLEVAWRRDKKYRSGVRFVLLEGLGRAVAGIELPRTVLRDALDRLRA